MTGYPHEPGWKVDGTSRRAAEAIRPRAKSIRDRVLNELRLADLTPDEIALRIGVDPASVRPRCSELKAQGLIIGLDIERITSRLGKPQEVLRARV